MTNRFSGLWILLLIPALLSAGPDHLYMTELVLLPNKAEYVQITNPTNQTIQLGDYYLTDATDTANGKYYYNLPSGEDFWSGLSSDFVARFPNMSIAPGQSLIVGLGRTSDYSDEYGSAPDLSLKNDMLSVGGEATIPGRLNGYLDDIAETLVLFYWDGSSTTVKDVDYLIWGNLSHAVDKTNVPGYAPDTPVSQQKFAAVHGIDQKMIHSDEGSEPTSGGNGITGHDETGEPLDTTWDVVDKGESKPTVGTLQRIPANPTTEDTLTFQVSVTDASDAVTVQLVTRFAGSKTVHPMTAISTDQYRVVLDPFTPSGTLIYYARAENAWGLKDSSLTQSVTISDPPEVLTIRDVRDNFEQYDGETVTLRGVMTIGSGKLRTDRLSAYFQDGSGRGLNVYRASMIDLPRGTDVEITGEITEFGGVKEIVVSSYNIIGTAPLPEPLNISVEVLRRNPLEYEGTYLRLSGMISSRGDNVGGGSNIDIDDGTGSVTIRIWNSTNVLVNESGIIVNDELDSLLQVGNMITVNSVGGVYNNNAQLWLAMQTSLPPGLKVKIGMLAFP
jgi:hypothetical protein